MRWFTASEAALRCPSACLVACGVSPSISLSFSMEVQARYCRRAVSSSPRRVRSGTRKTTMLRKRRRPRRRALGLAGVRVLGSHDDEPRAILVGDVGVAPGRHVHAGEIAARLLLTQAFEELHLLS